MNVSPDKVGARISSLRKLKRITQNELGEKLNVSFQAVSKWERGETLPDTSILIDLANALETTVDDILMGGEIPMNFKGKMSVKDMREGINCLERVGFLLGKQNIIYRHAIDGISERINSDIDTMLEDDFLRECLVLEAMIHNMRMGYYFDPNDVKDNFKYENWYNTFCEYKKNFH